MASFDDIEGRVEIDLDSNTFSVERNGKVKSYDIDDDADFLNRMVNSGNIDVIVWTDYEEQEYEVYSQRI